MKQRSRHSVIKELNGINKIDQLLAKHDKDLKTSTSSPKSNKKSHVKKSDPFSELVLTEHCKQRAKERFSMDEKRALGYFKTILKNAVNIGITKAEDGNDAILFASGRIAIYVSTDMKEIKTVMKQESVTYEPLKNKFAELHAKEIRKLQRKENARTKALQYEKLKANVEISNLELRLHKTRSESVRIACAANIKAIQEYLAELENEIKQIQIEKRQVSKSMVAVV